jgi:hypothetical protein
MRHSQAAQRWVLGAAFAVIELEFWLLTRVCGWIVCDSYALDAFHKQHPVLDFFVQSLWVVDGFGGVYILALALGVAFWWITIRKRPVEENEHRAP